MEYLQFRHVEGQGFMVFVAFHLFLLHFVNDRNSGFREALEAPKKWKIEFSKMMLFRQTEFTFRHFEGQDVMVFVVFHRFLLHFVNDRNSRLWEALEGALCRIQKTFKNIWDIDNSVMLKVEISRLSQHFIGFYCIL